MPFLPPNQQRQSTEGTNLCLTPEMQILLLTYLHSYLRGTQAICSLWLQPAKRCGITLDGMVEPPSKSAAFRSLGKSMVTAKDGLYYRCFFPSLELFLSKYWIEQNFVTNRLVYTSVTDNIDVFSSLIYVSDVLKYSFEFIWILQIMSEYILSRIFANIIGCDTGTRELA